MAEKENKRVLLLIDQLGSGGAERQLCCLAGCLHGAGYDVRLCRFYPGGVHYAADLEAAGVEPEVFESARRAWRRPFAIASLVRKWKPKAVIAFLDGTAMGACLARMLTPFNLLVSERNTTQNLSRRERAKFWLYRRADAVVCNSHSQLRFVNERFPELNSKAVAITNALDTERFSPAAHPPKLNRPRVLTTARITPQKNVLTYLRALAILKAEGVDAHFEWFGTPSDENYLNQVLALKKELGLDSYITFHVGGTRDVISEYRKSSHFILPSLYEGFPNVLCEAMSCGLVCTASAVSDSPDILSDKRFLFDPTKPEAIASAIKTMLALSPKETAAAAAANRDAVKRMCSLESFTKAYINLID